MNGIRKGATLPTSFVSCEREKSYIIPYTTPGAIFDNGMLLMPRVLLCYTRGMILSMFVVDGWIALLVHVFVWYNYLRSGIEHTRRQWFQQMVCN